MAATTEVRVRLRNDRWQTERVDEFTEVGVDTELADLFAYARCWAEAASRPDDADLTFSAMLAAMVAGEQPLSRWLRGYFDRLAVPSGDITKHRRYQDPPLYAEAAEGDGHLLTTISFRTAFALASELRDEISAGLPVTTRHFMAAYAVGPNYHLPDFRRYRIDRREWCLSLADELAHRYPDEAAGWARYRERAPDLLPMGFANDTPDGSDRLHLEREVSAFASLIASRSTATPLSIGVFGAWGSGKTFFMRRTRRRVDELAAQAADNPRESAFHSRIAQVEFNAWHYSEADLIASLVDHVLRNLRIGGVDEDEAAVKRRVAEIVALLDDAEQGLASAESGEIVAAERLKAAEVSLQQALAKLPETVRRAHVALSDAESAEQKVRGELRRAERERDEQIERAKRVAAGVVLVGEIGDETTKGAVQNAADSLLGLIGSGPEIKAKRRRILLGAALAGAAAIVAVLATTQAWGRVITAVTAIGAIAAAATKSLGFLGQLAERSERFEAARDDATQAAADRVAAEHADSLASLGAELAAAQEATTEARAQLESAAQETEETEALDAQRAEATAASAQRAEAQRVVDDLYADLDATSIDQRLAAFIDERMAGDDYHRRLGIYSQVRADFERLSRLMDRATADHFDDGRPPPTLSRIVLYIDDLDRCPEALVVEVLRAVHLLLAFDLFVCVVAVDPRWLTTCLRRAPGVAANVADGAVTSAAAELDEQVGRPADPADYIEKIFQIPIWLRPVPKRLRPALVRSWLDDPEPIPGVAPTTTTAGTLTTAELKFLDELAAFLPGKPRTLKRFANTYRLVRTSLSDVQFETFTSDGTSVAPYRICLAQLAVLSADRERALRMITSLDGTAAKTFESWLTELTDAEPGVAELLRTAMDGRLDLQEFRDWLERTRRYSFYL